MKRFIYATLCIVSLCMAGCGYDDDEVWNAIKGQEERIAALEAWQKTANENIAALQAIVNGNDYITSVEEIKEGDEVIGYTINFYRQGEVTIRNGKDGENGKMPVIGVSEGEDGRWYWTVNGELMKDADGNPVCASGKDGEDGEDGEDGQDGQGGGKAPVPQIKYGYELGYGGDDEYAVYLSVDGGLNWYKVSASNGSGGSGVFVSVGKYNTYYEFIFTTGGSIQVPKYTGLILEYLEYVVKEDYWKRKPITNGELEVETGKAFTVQCTMPAGGKLSWSPDKLKDENGNVWTMEGTDYGEIIDLRFAGIDNPGSVTMDFTLIAADNEVINYQVTITATGKSVGEIPYLQLSTNTYTAESEGETFEIAVEHNVSYQVQILDADWIVDAGSGTIAHRFEVLPNETDKVRTAEIMFVNEEYGLKEKLTVTQEAQEQTGGDANPYLTLISQPNKLSADEQEFTIKVESNQEKLDINIENNGWISMKNVSTEIGSDGAIMFTYTFTASANTTANDRVSQITFMNTVYGLNMSVAVKQEGNIISGDVIGTGNEPYDEEDGSWNVDVLD